MKTTGDSHKLRLGVFTIVGIAIFIFVIYLIGNKQGLFGQTNLIYAKFYDVSGLQSGNNVRYMGVNVGTVKKIIMENDTIIVAQMSIENKVFPFIKKDAIANISSDGLVGSMVVNISPGKGKFPSVNNGDTITSFSNVKLDDILKTLSVTNENIELLSTDLLEITHQITQGKGTIGLLLHDTTMGNDVKSSIALIKTSATKLSDIMGDVSLTIKNVDGMIQDLNKDNNVIGILKDTIIPQKINLIVDDVASAGKELDKIMKSANEFVSTLTEGEGILNHVVNDPKLVQQVDSIMANIHMASKSLNQNLEALKHNFLFRRYFKNLEKEEAKEK